MKAGKRDIEIDRAVELFASAPNQRVTVTAGPGGPVVTGEPLPPRDER